MTGWQDSLIHHPPQSMTLQPWRVVESQSLLTTRNLVDSQAEHEVLEALIESAKPSVDKSMHYLLFTPFRYPPLKYGSRFGGRFERGIWYGSLDYETALSEVGFYRLLFLRHSSAELGTLQFSVTAFQAHVQASKAHDFSCKVFESLQDQLMSPVDYTLTQKVGSYCRQHDIELITYFSARSRSQGKNVAIFSPGVFKQKAGRWVFNQQHWLGAATKSSVDFINQEKEEFSFIAGSDEALTPPASFVSES